jgi:hypothetical protein
MYQRAEWHARDSVVLFVESCTSMAPTKENLSLIKSTASCMRTALEANDIKPLRELIAKAKEWCGDLSDVLAAASHYLIETLGDLPVPALHRAVERVAEIERAVLSGLEGLGARAVAT